MFTTEESLMKRRILITTGIFAVGMIAAAGSGYAIEVCYDYAIWRLTGIDPKPKGDTTPGTTPRKTMFDKLEAKHYEKVVPTPKASELRADDVILLDGHVGYVTAPNAIDHFIQIEGTTHKGYRGVTRYSANELPRYPTRDGQPVRGGFFEGDSLQTFLTVRPFKPATTYEVWRQKARESACTLAGTWTFIVPALGSSTFSIDSKGATRESGMGSSTGTTVLNVRTLTYTWTTVYGYDGIVVINLNESCTEGRGTVTWTKYPPSEKRGTSFPATLTRRN